MKCTKAIVRRPGRNFAAGITAASLGTPDWRKAVAQHESYCNALESCGVELLVLEADDRYPDGCFVEDTAVIAGGAALITRPGAPARLGETEEMAEVLSRFMPVERVTAPGTLDGGDILRHESHFYIGRSARTDAGGAVQLAAFLDSRGYTSSEIEVTESLHLKSDIAYIGNGNFVCLPAYSHLAKGGHAIIPAAEEAYAANCLCVNGTLLLAAGYPGVMRDALQMGYEVIGLDVSEFRKMDGGLTCLSLLF